MAADTIIELTAHCPPGVTEILATSFDYYIGRIDHETVLKYLHKKQSPDIEAQENLAVEAQIYTILRHHHRIISFKGGNTLQGLRLEFATNGSGRCLEWRCQLELAANRCGVVSNRPCCELVVEATWYSRLGPSCAAPEGSVNDSHTVHWEGRSRGRALMV